MLAFAVWVWGDIQLTSFDFSTFQVFFNTDLALELAASWGHTMSDDSHKTAMYLHSQKMNSTLEEMDNYVPHHE